MIICTSSALEAFIRAKYEQRKWLAKDWIPPEITVSSDVSVVYDFFFFFLTFVSFSHAFKCISNNEQSLNTSRLIFLAH